MNTPEMNQKSGEKSRRMGKTGVLLFFILSVILVVFLLRFSAGKQETALSIALYPYVPDQDRFQQAVEAEWSKYHPEVKLNFVSWDSYREDPPEDLDVFTYDALFFYDFLEKGYLLPIAEEDIREVDDFVPCALSACSEDGINANIRDEKKALAVELLNIITGKEVMVAASSATQADQFPQYLLAARPGIYDELAEKYPVYADLKKIVSNPKSRIFSVRSGGRNMIEEAARAFNQPVPAK